MNGHARGDHFYMAKPELGPYFRGLSDQLQRDVRSLQAGQAARVAVHEDVDLSIGQVHTNGAKPKQERRRYTCPGNSVIKPPTLGEVARIIR